MEGMQMAGGCPVALLGSSACTTHLPGCLCTGSRGSAGGGE